MRRLLRRLLFVTLLCSVALPVPGADAAGEVERAEARRDAARAEADGVARRYEQARARFFELDAEIDHLEQGIRVTRADADALRSVATERAVAAYMGRRRDVADLVSSGDVLESARRDQLLQRVNASGVDAVDRLGALTEDLEVRQAELAERRREQEGVVDELRSLEAQLRRALEDAEAELTRARAEEARRREAARRAAAQRAAAAARPVSSPGGDAGGGGGGAPGQIVAPPAGGGFVCPVQGAVSFVDSWGAPRSGGRRHQGVDMMAGTGTPLVAVVAGTITQRSGGLGGNSIWLRGTNGASYYYAHLNSFVGGPRSVSAGEMIGTVGDSGNARGGAPHLHFEIHPGGRGAVNPTPTVAAAC